MLIVLDIACRLHTTNAHITPATHTRALPLHFPHFCTHTARAGAHAAATAHTHICTLARTPPTPHTAFLCHPLSPCTPHAALPFPPAHSPHTHHTTTPHTPHYLHTPAYHTSHPTQQSFSDPSYLTFTFVVVTFGTLHYLYTFRRYCPQTPAHAPFFFFLLLVLPAFSQSDHGTLPTHHCPRLNRQRFGCKTTHSFEKK